MDVLVMKLYIIQVVLYYYKSTIFVNQGKPNSFYFNNNNNTNIVGTWLNKIKNLKFLDKYNCVYF